MKKLGLAGLVVTALVLPPATATAADGTDKTNAARECKALRASSGTAANFRSVVAAFATGKVTEKNAYGKCVSAKAREEATENREAKTNAAKQCRAEQEADPAAFTAKYGTGKQGRNAFGKCVSGKAKQAKAEADAEDRDRVNAAKQCRAEQKADPAKFAATYGTKRNAFGKCVSAKARAKND